MRLTIWLAALATILVSPALADLTDFASEFPPCALNCLLELIPQSGCPITNTTCVCSNTELNTVATSCIKEQCTVEEALTSVKITNLACGVPEKDRSNLLWGTLYLACTTCVLIILRLASRFDEGSFKQDDYCMFAVLLVLIPTMTVVTLATKHGFGQNVWVLKTEDTIIALKYMYFTEILYMMLIGLTKISIISLYLRIFPSRRFKIIAYTLIAWIVLTIVVFALLTIFQCNPIWYNWRGWLNKEGPRSKCLDVYAPILAHGLVNLLEDFAVLILPLPSLIRLKIEIKKKIFVVSLFSLGTIICATAIIRVIAISKLTATLNPTKDYVDTIFWSCLEADLGIIVPNIAAIRSFFARRFPRFFASSTTKSYTDTTKSRGRTSVASGPYRMSYVGQPGGDIKRPVGAYLPDVSMSESEDVKGSITTGEFFGTSLADTDTKVDFSTMTERTIDDRVLTPRWDCYYESASPAESQENIVATEKSNV